MQEQRQRSYSSLHRRNVTYRCVTVEENRNAQSLMLAGRISAFSGPTETSPCPILSAMQNHPRVRDRNKE
jgi:hypothetical protein